MSNQNWSDRTFSGTPAEVIGRYAAGARREDVAADRQRSERASMLREKQRDLADAFAWNGVPIPSSYDVFRRAVAGDAIADAQQERQRAAQLEQHEAKVAELEMAGRSARSHAEICAGYSLSCLVTDAAQARAEREATVNAGVPYGWPSQRSLARVQADRQAAAESTPATLADLGQVESAAQQTISRLKARLHAHGWLPTG
jgi:hypothetical protein